MTGRRRPGLRLRAAALALAALAVVGAVGRPPDVAAALPPIGGQPTPAPVRQSGDTLMAAVSDAELAYRVLGQGEPLLLIQGFRATMDDWDPTLLDATGGSAAERGQRLIGVLLPTDWIATNLAYLRRLAARPREPSPAATIAQQRQAMNDWAGTCERLWALHLPTLVLVGVEDEVLVPANGMLLAERIPGAWLVQLAGGGHGMMYQYPRQLAATIGLFLTAP